MSFRISEKIKKIPEKIRMELCVEKLSSEVVCTRGVRAEDKINILRKKYLCLKCKEL